MRYAMIVMLMLGTARAQPTTEDWAAEVKKPRHGSPQLREALSATLCAVQENISRQIVLVRKTISYLSTHPFNGPMGELLVERQTRHQQLTEKVQDVKDAMIAEKLTAMPCGDSKVKRLTLCERVWGGATPPKYDGSCDDDPNLAIYKDMSGVPKLATDE